MPKQITKNKSIFTVDGSHEHWNAVANNSWESKTFEILDHFLGPDDIMFDIGAWIGPISLYCADKVRACYSFEPDPVAFQEFINNLKLNSGFDSKIFPFNQALTTDGKKVKLFSRFSYGDSGSSLLKRVKSKNNFVEVDSTTFEQFISKNNINNIDFIKMDIEGGEFFILPEIIEVLIKKKPTLLISFHPLSLLEYYELKFIPFGILRRVYRHLDPKKQLLRNKVNKRISELLQSLSFYKIYDSEQNLISLDALKKNADSLQNLDMLIFSTKNPS